MKEQSNKAQPQQVHSLCQKIQTKKVQKMS